MYHNLTPNVLAITHLKGITGKGHIYNNDSAVTESVVKITFFDLLNF